MKKKTVNYIDKKEMYEEILKYNTLCKEAENSGLELPSVSNKLGQMFIDISKGTAARPNFSGYPFKEDMIGDGVENCLRAIRNFDPEKGNNPFGYFSRIIWFAFLRRIDTEKRALYNKHKVIEQCMISGDDVYANDGDQRGSGFLSIDTDYMNDFVETFEKAQNEKKLKRKESANTGLDEFLE